jgi:hypothetical protein
MSTQQSDRPEDCECAAQSRSACWPCRAHGYVGPNPDVQVVNAYKAAEDDQQWLILGVGTVDEARSSGRWLKTTDWVEAEQ